MKIKSKLLWCSSLLLIAILCGQKFLSRFEGFRSSIRKCAPYKPFQFDITFSHRKECLKIVEESQSSDKMHMTSEDTIDEIRLRGYNASSHTLLTKDGYYLTIYRISGGMNSPPRKGKKPVLLFHGFLMTGASWIIQPGSRNLAFTLVDAGYEVWLGNSRGTSPSQKHISLDANKDIDYWNFGSVQLSTIDLPLTIDLILQETSSDKLYYVCHSMSCGALLVGLADVPELNDKIEASFLLAPPSHYGSVYNPAFLLFPPILGTPWQDVWFRLMGGRINGKSGAFRTALGLTTEKVCGWSFMRCGICDNFLFALFGADPEQMDYNNLPNIMRKLMDNGAIKPFLHGLQVDEACAFQRFDYGASKNLLEYGSPKPPLYNMSGISVPIYLFYGENDNLVTPWDAERLRNAMPPDVMRGFHKVEWPKFNHVDFMIAKDADILVYNKIRDIIDEIEADKICYLQQNSSSVCKSEGCAGEK
ncbi:unnamed protein product [Orchesella dallaii]|uniref:Partial AB-hydrolase lipase domain-containing protein n=1 Tax=Orchesella dallaii TaxID=48710 RepID=A0ABP1RN25_9HEXA